MAAATHASPTSLNWEVVKQEILNIIKAVHACRVQATQAVRELHALLDFDGVHKLLCSTAPDLIRSIAKVLTISHQDPKTTLRSIETLIRRENDPI